MNKNKLACASAAFVVLKLSEKDKKKRRRWWQNSLCKNRALYGGSDLLRDLQEEEAYGMFRNFCRISSTDFEKLLELVELKIMKSDTNYRKAIPARERLALTLHFLASGDSYSSLMYTFKISKQVISKIVPETCDAIIEVLQDFVKLPKTEEDWIHIANRYEQLWNFPNCVGSIDGKHIVIQAPINSGSDYFNYKSTFSIVLMAVVDADYCFISANVGCQGRISDAGVIKHTSFFQKLQAKQLNLPPKKMLPQTEKLLPYVFVADEAFPLQEHILKPYPGIQQKGTIERVFNYRLSRARRVVENAFGILSSVFRVLRKPMLLEPTKVEKVVLACIYLHNFLRKSESSQNIYTPQGSLDTELDGEVTEGTWRTEMQDTTSFKSIRKIARKSAAAVEYNRKHFAEYYATTGKVPWQDLYA